MDSLNNIIKSIDDFVWGIPLIVLIMACGIWLTIRCCGLQFRHLGKALKFMVKNEEGGDGEVSSFAALCTALSATIGTGNIVGVATALAAGGPGALFWMIAAALFGMATKYAEGFLAIKYRTIDAEGHYHGGPYYYIEHGMGAKWKWLAKLFANGQVATQYVTPDGQLSVDEEWNVNGSYMNIEGITSPDGRILGKMAHSERRGDGVAINIYGEQDIKIFESGVEYFK